MNNSTKFEFGAHIYIKLLWSSYVRHHSHLEFELQPRNFVHRRVNTPRCMTCYRYVYTFGNIERDFVYIYLFIFNVLQSESLLNEFCYQPNLMICFQGPPRGGCRFRSPFFKEKKRVSPKKNLRKVKIIKQMIGKKYKCIFLICIKLHPEH